MKPETGEPTEAVSRPRRGWRCRALSLAAEPILHFFVIGALLFVAHRLIVGDPRVVVVTRGVKAELERRFRDHNGRPPSSSELDGEVRAWELDEALYREALRDRLDRNDATIRTVLADRVRARAALAVARRQPSDAELDSWLAMHRSLYEAPRRYDFGTVSFSRRDPGAAVALEKYERALKAGASPNALGRPIVGGDLTAEELEGRFGAAVAARLQSLPVGQWQRLESESELLLVRVNAVEGGLPSADELHRRLVADWSFAERKRVVDEALQAIIDRYRFEQRP